MGVSDEKEGREGRTKGGTRRKDERRDEKEGREGRTKGGTRRRDEKEGRKEGREGGTRRRDGNEGWE